MLKISETQRVVLRAGSVVMFAGAVVAMVIALMVDTSRPTSDDVTPIQDPSSAALPSAGLFGGSVVIYGDAEDPGASPHDLGCRLVRNGEEMSSAKMSETRVLISPPPPVTVDGTRLVPLFQINDYGSAELSCDTTSAVEPLAVSTPSTFGSLGLLVKVVAGVLSVMFVLMGVFALVAFRPRRS